MKQKKAMLDASKKLAIVFTAAGLLSPGTVISAGQGYKAVTVGNNHSCALHESGKIECWGSSYYTAAPEGKFTQIDAGRQHTCALNTAGKVQCWGKSINWNRTGSSHNRYMPPDVKFIQISSGDSTSCGVKEDGSLACWGATGGVVENTPIKHPAAKRFSSVSARSYEACGLHTDGTALCWSTRIKLDGRFKQLSLGLNICGIRPDDTLACWKNRYPAKAPKGTFRQISVNQFNCGVHTDGHVECWSYADPCCNNSSGQLNPPEGAFTQVDVGSSHACGIKEDKTVACWGAEHN